MSKFEKSLIVRHLIVRYLTILFTFTKMQLNYLEVLFILVFLINYKNALIKNQLTTIKNLPFIGIRVNLFLITTLLFIL